LLLGGWKLGEEKRGRRSQLEVKEGTGLHRERTRRADLKKAGKEEEGAAVPQHGDTVDRGRRRASKGSSHQFEA